MEFKPHQYQRFAIERILDQPATALFLDMGMGKTVCTLTAVSELLHDRFEVRRVLVIAPLRVAEDTWIREADKWDHTRYLRVARALGSEKERIRALQSDADIYVINRENVEWLVDYYGKRWPFDMVVIDELSSFKSPSARRFKALRKVRPLVKRIVGLTGTPAPNGLLDLWSQVYLLDRGERLGSTVTGYRERYFEPDQRNRTTIFSWRLKIGAEEKIHGLLSDICVSMSAADWLDMPDRIDRTVPVVLPPETKERMARLEKDLVLPLMDADVTADTAAVLRNKLLQMANGAVYDENGAAQEIHSEKLKALAEIIEDANGKPVLVFYSYQHDRDRILKTIKGARMLETSQDIASWNAGKVPVMLAHPASAGHGLNLQAGGHVIVWFGIPDSLELYQQANGRLHRQGQEHSVIIHHLVAEGTFDEDVMARLADKDEMQGALLDAVKARIEKWRARTCA